MLHKKDGEMARIRVERGTGWGLALGAALLVVLAWGVPAHAQPSASGGEAASRPFEQGMAALQQGEPARAVRLLRSAVAEAPAYLDAARGSAAYWLGRARRQAGQDSALHVWREGLLALKRAGRFDVRLADAYIQEVYAQKRGTQYGLASQSYLDLLAAADEVQTPLEQSVIAKHLGPLSVVLPAALRRSVGLEGAWASPRTAKLPEGAGARLVAWWRGQDPLPATVENERLSEHLARVAEAHRRYRTSGQLDDRAKIYIRLGAPYKETTVPFDETRFTRTTFQFPENEFWVYPAVDDRAHYLFIETRRGYYEIGKPSDLVPRSLRTGSARTADMYVRVTEALYRQLALLHQHYATPYVEVADYATVLDQREIAGGQVMVSPVAPTTFVQSFSSKTESDEDLLAFEREEAVPPAHTNVYDDAEPLPVAVRHARFLEADGATRTEVYWSVPARALLPEGATDEEAETPIYYVVAGTLVQRGEDNRVQERVRRRHLIPVAPSAPASATTHPQVYTARTTSARFGIGLQWDEYETTIDPATQRVKRLGRRVKRSVYREDSLTALQRDPEVLEMSDLKPLYLPSAEASDAPALDEAQPYPFDYVTPSTQLALYFEAYHLNYDESDRTRYTVGYEVERSAERSVADRVLQRRDEQQRTTTQTETTGESRRAEEYLLLDLSDWGISGTLRITVRVTDEVTGQQAERVLEFTLRPGPPPPAP